MQQINIRYQYTWIFILVVAGIFASCMPEDEELTLGDKPEVSFTVTPLEERVNTYLLESETDAAAYQWDTGNGFETGSKIDTAYFPLAGEYIVKLNAFTHAGMVTAETTVVVAENDPAAGCTGDEIALLSGCSDSQTWVLAGAGSIFVGPGDGTAWWELPASDVEMRSCVLNDQFTFYADGTFTYDNLGDVWVEADSPLGLTNADACGSWDEVGPEYAAWGPADDYTYSVASNEITVTGEGAFLGIYKVANTPTGGAQTPDEAGGAVTYEILELTSKKLVIRLGYDGGEWKFTFKPEGAEDDPENLVEGDNILQGSDMEDESVWTVSDVGLSLTDVEFVDGVLKFTNGTESAQTNVGVWQAVEVEADQVYKFFATVNDPGSTGSWIEFYAHTAEPVDGNDYTEGKVASEDLITFDEAGTAYVMIKVGSWDGNLGAEGVTVDDVRLVEMN